MFGGDATNRYIYDADNLVMKIYSGTIYDDRYGYICVLDSEKFKQCNNTCQYISFVNLNPVDCTMNSVL